MPDDESGRRDDTPAPPTSHRRARRRWPLALGALAVLAVGLAAGGAIVTVTGISGEHEVTVVPSPSPSPVVPTASGDAATGRVTVGEACIRALDQAEAIYQELQRMGSAAAELDFEQLDHLVRRLQAMRPALQSNLGECHATIRVPHGSPSPAPTLPAQGG